MRAKGRVMTQQRPGSTYPSSASLLAAIAALSPATKKSEAVQRASQNLAVLATSQPSIRLRKGKELATEAFETRRMLGSSRRVSAKDLEGPWLAPKFPRAERRPSVWALEIHGERTVDAVLRNVQDNLRIEFLVDFLHIHLNSVELALPMLKLRRKAGERCGSITQLPERRFEHPANGFGHV